jgi:hypothetical protein
MRPIANFLPVGTFEPALTRGCDTPTSPPPNSDPIALSPIPPLSTKNLPMRPPVTDSSATVPCTECTSVLLSIEVYYIDSIESIDGRDSPLYIHVDNIACIRIRHTHKSNNSTRATNGAPSNPSFSFTSTNPSASRTSPSNLECPTLYWKWKSGTCL